MRLVRARYILGLCRGILGNAGVKGIALTWHHR